MFNNTNNDNTMNNNNNNIISSTGSGFARAEEGARTATSI